MIAKGMVDANGNKIEFEPPTPTYDKRGGIYAKTVEDTSGLVEVVVGLDGKGYCGVNQNALYAQVIGEEVSNGGSK